ncbi:hypothetical protein SynBOUM118_02091 [Synechococcus sp. BOUM118]|nr:hypothetical protein SynBOUM118_02091 [Synechococcus sp. BOUM118]
MFPKERFKEGQVCPASHQCNGRLRGVFGYCAKQLEQPCQGLASSQRFKVLVFA